jgi:hypothetical protein
MSFIIDDTTATVHIKLTDKGRELITRGTLEQDFDIVKFAFGDSDVDYQSNPEAAIISSPPSRITDLTSKLYQSGTMPEGDLEDAHIKVNGSEDSANLTMSTFSTPKTNNCVVSSLWLPFTDYRESYTWENLGPLNDWDFNINVSSNKKSAKIESLGITGTAKIKIKGSKTNKYGILNLTIE